MIARREAFLTDYQNAAWARRYRALVDRVRAAEDPYGTAVLTEAVARSLFKLMSYKDEYEVARLHMETGFLDKLREDFEGDFKVNYHLAPPLLATGKDARGRPRKRQFGQWMQTPFRILARLKGLRGTALDPFGYTAERTMERELIPWFEGVVEDLLLQLPDRSPEELATVARMAMDIRGFGPVKDAAVAKVKTEVAAAIRPAAPRPLEQIPAGPSAR
jgi:indolepyruvate ferredoxin oxidoreductase